VPAVDPTTGSGRSAIRKRIADLPRSSRRRAIELALLALLVVVPLVSADAFFVDRLGRYLLWAALAVSLDLIWGFGGILSFGHAAFFGGAGYVVGLLTTTQAGVLPLGVWPAIALAVVASAALAAIVAGAAFRGRTPLRGVEFALVTLAVAFLFEQYARSSRVLGGQNGILLQGQLSVAGWSVHRGRGFYALALVVLVVSYLLCAAFLRARSGRVLQAVRENEERVETLGYDAGRVRFQVYVLSGAIAGAAGAVFYVHDQIVSPGAVGVGASTLVLLWVVLGGRGTLLGPVVATVLLQHLTATLSGTFLDTWLFAVGTLLIVAILLLPGGLLGWVGRGQMR
jgi:urea transport system permease protein